MSEPSAIYHRRRRAEPPDRAEAATRGRKAMRRLEVPAHTKTLPVRGGAGSDGRAGPARRARTGRSVGGLCL